MSIRVVPRGPVRYKKLGHSRTAMRVVEISKKVTPYRIALPHSKQLRRDRRVIRSCGFCEWSKHTYSVSDCVCYELLKRVMA